MKPSMFDYISVGGNRHPSAAAWDEKSGLLAFGADQNVALWKPLAANGRGILDILCGPSDEVTAVQFGEGLPGSNQSLLSGSTNGELCLWQKDAIHSPSGRWKLRQRLKAHVGAVNSVGTLAGWQLFVTAGADSTLKLWRLYQGEEAVKLIHTISLRPRYIPTSVAIGDFQGCKNKGEALFVVVGGTRPTIQIYVVSNVQTEGEEASHSLQATMAGHESWVTSLALKKAGPHGGDSDDATWLASASQDKSIRIWCIRQADGCNLPNSPNEEDSLQKSLTAKAYNIRTPSVILSITFEALLLGHEDWIYTVSWNPQPYSLQLLSASADNSLIIWQPETSADIWVNKTRLGEISGQKGATSATGSTGGFWMGLWAPDGNAVTSLGKTGSWRLWWRDMDRSYWVQTSGLTGHTKAVMDLSWTERGEYLLSTSSDQTTRLHAGWQSEKSTSWHEFARPQIHGYDLNCVQSLGRHRFVSGADEKLLRVFEQPRNVAQMLERLCGIGSVDRLSDMPGAANMPVLGLSNKAVLGDSAGAAGGDAFNGDDAGAFSGQTSYESTEPPNEDYLARHTLWPEHEKLYGHGYEISELAANASGTIIATACKASSTEHAVIRLYETESWHEIRPPLRAHALTISSMQFDPIGNRLLSGGRDRQWSVFKPSDGPERPGHSTVSHYSLQATNPKGHSRMILDVAWSAPQAGGGHSTKWPPFIATASRDKTVKIWTVASGRGGKSEEKEIDKFSCQLSLTRLSPVTAIDFHNELSLAQEQVDMRCLAVGEESGGISYHLFSVVHVSSSSCQDADVCGEGEFELHIRLLWSVDLDESLCPSKAVMRLAWRPGGPRREPRGQDQDQDQDQDRGKAQLAAASADSSLRILSIDGEELGDAMKSGRQNDS